MSFFQKIESMCDSGATREAIVEEVALANKNINTLADIDSIVASLDRLSCRSVVRGQKDKVELFRKLRDASKEFSDKTYLDYLLKKGDVEKFNGIKEAIEGLNKLAVFRDLMIVTDFIIGSQAISSIDTT